MKYLKYIPVFFLLLIAIYACKKNDLNKNVVYLAAAETNNVTTLTVENTGGEFVILSKSSKPVSSPVTINVTADNSLIDAYNQLNDKHYSALPANSYELSAETQTIAAGTNLSDKISLKIISVANFEDGKTYMVPIRIQSISGGSTSILEASKTLYIIINKVIIATVASLAGNYLTVDFVKGGDALKSLTNLTLETRVMVNSFQASSPFISSVMGIEEEFLLRFGDVTVKPNQLQVAGGPTATNVSTEFSTGTWYHLAAVYNGSQLRVYVNGELAASKDAVRTIDLTNSRGFQIGRSAGGRLLNGAISEARVWTKALTQAEINNGMCVVDPASNGLLAYWKFNQSTGNTVTDVSGHGYDAIANRAITWIPNVRCN